MIYALLPDSVVRCFFTAEVQKRHYDRAGLLQLEGAGQF